MESYLSFQGLCCAAGNAFDTLELGVLFGAFTAVLVLFCFPVTLLGTISPFAIRLAVVDSRRTGQTAGELYGISTLGSFIGSFLPGLLFIPLIGTFRTFLLFSSVLLVVALVGLGLFGSWRSVLKFAWMPLVLLGLWLFGTGGPLKASAGQIYETESAYNYIQVLEIDGYRLLRLNEGQGVHSIWNPQVLDYQGPWEEFLAAPFFNAVPYTPGQVQSMAIVGLAAGTTAHQASVVFGPIPIDGFELDPKIIEVGRKYFDMNMPNLNAVAQDGRVGLSHSPRKYDLIAVDAYRPPYIPFHLTTREFFQQGYDHLTENGVLVINVGHSITDRRLIDGLASTLQAVFPSVYVMDVPGSFNSIVYATRQPTNAANLALNLAALEQSGTAHPLLLDAIRRAVVYQQPTPPPGLVFTDDRSPVEWITNTMVLSFIFSGEVEELPK